MNAERITCCIDTIVGEGCIDLCVLMMVVCCGEADTPLKGKPYIGVKVFPAADWCGVRCLIPNPVMLHVESLSTLMLCLSI